MTDRERAKARTAAARKRHASAMLLLARGNLDAEQEAEVDAANTELRESTKELRHLTKVMVATSDPACQRP